MTTNNRKRSLHPDDQERRRGDVGKKKAEDMDVEDDDENLPKTIIPLDEDDVSILKSYGQQTHGPYSSLIARREEEIEEHKERVNRLLGVRESDTGLLPPSNWDLQNDRIVQAQEAPLEVATCTKIILPSDLVPAAGGGDAEMRDETSLPKPWDRLAPAKQDADRMYVVKIPPMAKFVVGLGEKVSPTDIEEGMRVGVDRARYSIQVPLPSRIDAAVSLMQVEEKPDVSYQDVGGCDDAVKALREVVEVPLLNPDRFIRLGIDPPKGVLLYGLPGKRDLGSKNGVLAIRVSGDAAISTDLIRNSE